MLLRFDVSHPTVHPWRKELIAALFYLSVLVSSVLEGVPADPEEWHGAAFKMILGDDTPKIRRDLLGRWTLPLLAGICTDVNSDMLRKMNPAAIREVVLIEKGVRPSRTPEVGERECTIRFRIGNDHIEKKRFTIVETGETKEYHYDTHEPPRKDANGSVSAAGRQLLWGKEEMKTENNEAGWAGYVSPEFRVAGFLQIDGCTTIYLAPCMFNTSDPLQNAPVLYPQGKGISEMEHLFDFSDGLLSVLCHETLHTPMLCDVCSEDDRHNGCQGPHECPRTPTKLRVLTLNEVVDAEVVVPAKGDRYGQDDLGELESSRGEEVIM